MLPPPPPPPPPQLLLLLPPPLPPPPHNNDNNTSHNDNNNNASYNLEPHFLFFKPNRGWILEKACIKHASGRFGCRLITHLITASIMHQGWSSVGTESFALAMPHQLGCAKGPNHHCLTQRVHSDREEAQLNLNLNKWTRPPVGASRWSTTNFQSPS